MMVILRIGSPHVDIVNLVGGPLGGARAWVTEALDPDSYFAAIGAGLAVPIDPVEAVEVMLILHRYRQRDDVTFEYIADDTGTAPVRVGWAQRRGSRPRNRRR